MLSSDSVRCSERRRARGWTGGDFCPCYVKGQVQLICSIGADIVTNRRLVIKKKEMRGRTFSLCLRGAGGLSGAWCLFTSSSIVDLAWGCGECMSRREGRAAGVGITSTTLSSPGDFLETHGAKRKMSCFINDQLSFTSWRLIIEYLDTLKKKQRHRVVTS